MAGYVRGVGHGHGRSAFLVSSTHVDRVAADVWRVQKPMFCWGLTRCYAVVMVWKRSVLRCAPKRLDMVTGRPQQRWGFFTVLAHGLDPLLAAVAATGAPFSDAVEAIGVAARAASLRLAPVNPWTFASNAICGRLLSNTS